MFEKLIKGITKMVSWGIRKLGGGLAKISSKLLNYGIKMSDTPVLETTLTSMEEVDQWGTYGDISDYDRLPFDKIVETKDKLTRNYLTKIQMYWRIQGKPEPLSEIISIMHDKNITMFEINTMLQEKANKYAMQEGYQTGEIIHTERMITLHSFNSPY